ncbi:MAG: hypothetical protein IKO91_00580 [Oscillospiraceae bacterium]|nr:hypothetical protein [Oscillospiraceae bacterium]
MRWIIPVSELSKIAKELRKDGMDYVELELLEGDPIPSMNPSPPSVLFSGFRKAEPEFMIEYDEIDVVSGFDDVETVSGNIRF